MTSYEHLKPTKLDVKYPRTLKKAFDDLDFSDSSLAIDPPPAKAVAEFHKASKDPIIRARFTPIETFVSRMANLAPDLEISSERVLDLSDSPAKALRIHLGNRDFWIRNVDSATHTNPETTHADNQAFIKNVHDSILAFSSALALEKPDMKDAISDHLRLLENRLSQMQHHLIARAGRQVIMRIGRAIRHGTLSQSTAVLPFSKPENS